MQILHFGRYAHHAGLVAPSALQAPISPFMPHALTDDEVEQTVEDFVRAAALAQSRGLRRRRDHGLRGLSDQRVHRRGDQPARATAGAARTRTACASRSRSCAGCGSGSATDFILIYRLSMLDLVPGGSTLDEVITLAQAIEAAGATIINTGIGWHEARIPTIATSVPRGAYGWVTKKVMGAVSVPLVDQQPHQHPRGRRGVARRRPRGPGLDGPAAARRPRVRRQGAGGPGRRHQHLHRLQPGLPGPHLQREDHVLPGQPAGVPRDRAGPRPDPARKSGSRVVGAGPAGLACAVSAAERGHAVTLFDAADRDRRPAEHRPQGAGQGGVRRDAALLPARSSSERRRRRPAGRRRDRRDPRRRTASTRSCWPPASTPRDPGDPRHATTPASSAIWTCCATGQTVGERVAIIGAGGIGFDVAEFLTDGGERRRPGRGGLLPAVGRRHRLRRTAAASPRPAARAAARRPPAPAQDQQGRRGAGQDDRLDPPDRAAAPRRDHARRRRRTT